MTLLSDDILKTRTLNKIRYLEDQLASLDHYLPDTYQYILEQLDLQKLILTKLEVQECFADIDHHESPNSSAPS